MPDAILQEMLDIIDWAPNFDDLYAPSIIHMAQNHIFYMTYIESHYPEINIKDLVSADFQFVSPGDQRIYSRLFHTYLGKIIINKEATFIP